MLLKQRQNLVSLLDVLWNRNINVDVSLFVHCRFPAILFFAIQVFCTYLVAPSKLHELSSWIRWERKKYLRKVGLQGHFPHFLTKNSTKTPSMKRPRKTPKMARSKTSVCLAPPDNRPSVSTDGLKTWGKNNQWLSEKYPVALELRYICNTTTTTTWTIKVPSLIIIIFKSSLTL